MPIVVPINFNGQSFATKYNLNPTDFWIDGGLLYCPSLPNLTDADLLDCVLTVLDLQNLIDAENRKSNARVNAKAIPDWAGWTEAEVLAWLQTNIGTPLTTPIPANPMTVQQIRAVLVSMVDVIDKMYTAEKAMARMIVAMRDELWSDLKDV